MFEEAPEGVGESFHAMIRIRNTVRILPFRRVHDAQKAGNPGAKIFCCDAICSNIGASAAQKAKLCSREKQFGEGRLPGGR